MTPRASIFIASIVALSMCSAAGAQVRSGAALAQTASARAMPSASTAAGRRTASRGVSSHHTSPRTHISAGTSPFTHPFALDNISGVPGLGFDFPHLAAVGSGRDQIPFGSAGRHDHHGDGGNGFFMPILFGGVPYYYDDAGGEQPGQEPVETADAQSQGAVAQEPASGQDNNTAALDMRNSSESATDTQTAVPVRDVGDFILVRRDGRILFASLFSVVGAQLQYVTPEGIRHTLAMTNIDADATEQMNAARGTIVQLRP